eukprot:3794795-Prymnesium_polylepis.1
MCSKCARRARWMVDCLNGWRARACCCMRRREWRSCVCMSNCVVGGSWCLPLGGSRPQMRCVWPRTPATDSGTRRVGAPQNQMHRIRCRCRHEDADADADADADVDASAAGKRRMWCGWAAGRSERHSTCEGTTEPSGHASAPARINTNTVGGRRLFCVARRARVGRVAAAAHHSIHAARAISSCCNCSCSHGAPYGRAAICRYRGGAQ